MKIIIFFLCIILLTSCVTKLYEGPTLPKEQVCILKYYQGLPWRDSRGVDGFHMVGKNMIKKHWRVWYGFDHSHKLKFLPGHYVIKAGKYIPSSGRILYINESINVDIDYQKQEFDFKGGHEYKLEPWIKTDMQTSGIGIIRTTWSYYNWGFNIEEIK